MKSTNKTSGQALMELLVSSSLLLAVISGAGWVFHCAWERGKCAYMVFEATRSVLADGGPSRGIALQSWRDSDGEVVGRGRCGRQVEQVGFRKLEGLQEWK